MTPTAERIAEEALRLSPEERADLADRLIQSLDSAEQEEIGRALGELAEARIDAFEASGAKAIPIEEVFERIWGPKS
jgi:putative addiction module component (TIGR02574 family)